MGLNWTLQVFDALPSTQDVCKQHARDGAAEGLVIQALQQDAGKGRHGREWVSGQGNLAVSFILRPGCAASDVGQVSILTGVALAKTIRQFTESKIHLKWPNDVMLAEKKCAGILMETDINPQGDIEWLVIGVGVNIATAPDMGHALHDYGAVDIQTFLNTFLDEVRAYYMLWQAGKFADIRHEWLGFSYKRGTPLNVGVFETVDENGNLVVLNEENELKTISAGDVYLKDRDYAAGN